MKRINAKRPTKFTAALIITTTALLAASLQSTFAFRSPPTGKLVKLQQVCSMSDSAYLITSKATTSRTGTQQAWIKVKSTSESTIRVQVDQGKCIQATFPSTNNVWKFIKIPTPTRRISSGNHTITVGASKSTLNWSTLWLFRNSYTCTPNIDTTRLTCQGAGPLATRVYASGASALISTPGGPSATSTTTPVPTTTSKPVTTVAPTTTRPATTTTVRPVTTVSPTTTTRPPTTNCFSNSIGVVEHPLNLSSTGRQKVWVSINSTKATTLTLRIDTTECISQALPSTNGVWTWVSFSSFTPQVNSGSHKVTIGSTSDGVKLSKFIAFNSSISCTPNGDGTNCPPPPSTTTTRPPTTVAPTTTQPPTTTTPVTSPPQNGNGNADNLALEKFRNKDALYNRFGNTPSASLDLTKLISPASPSSSIFFQNPPNAGQFRTICEFSHYLYDDPIIKPMQPGASHLHMFYGNTGANGNSTASSIVNTGGSTCDGQEANRTAYWFPAVHDAQGRARTPNGFVMYYKSEGVAKPPGGYTEMPQGLKMIAGNANATSPQVVQYNNGWGCGNMFINPNSALIPSCNQSTGLMLKVHFPRCWDGSFEFDPAKPQEHVMYEINGKCPTTHPKVFSGMTALFDWDLAPGETTNGWYLSSDRVPGKAVQPGGTTIHGDWFGGWHTTVMSAWTRGCSNADWNCSVSFLGTGTSIPGIRPGVTSLNRTTYKYDTMGPITCVLPPRTYK